MNDDSISNDLCDYESYQVNPTTGLIIPDGSNVDVGGNSYGAFESSNRDPVKITNDSNIGKWLALFIFIGNISIFLSIIWKIFF